MFFLLFFLVLAVLKVGCLLLMRKSAIKTPAWAFPLSLVGAVLGGGSVLGAAEEAYRFGWAFLLYPLGFGVGFVALGLLTGRRLRRLGLSTVAGVFERVYASLALKRGASLISIVSLFLILVVQILGTKKMLFALGLESATLFGAMWGLIFLYVILGGFRAVIMTHLVQTLFFIALLLGIGVWLFFSQPPLTPLNVTSLSSSTMTGWLLMPAFYFLISQDLAQRCLSAPSGRTIVWGSVIAGVAIFVIMAIPVYIGHLAHELGITSSSEASVFLLVLDATLPAWIQPVVCAGLVAAIMSTAGSLLHAIGANLTHDFSVNRSVSVCVAVSAVIIGWLGHNIIELAILGYELSICTLFVPIFLALYRQKGGGRSALVAMLIGGVALLVFRLFPIPCYQLVSLFLASLAFLVTESTGKRIANARA